MGADAVHVFFGLRMVPSSDVELAALEEGTDPRVLVAARAGLKTYFGRPTDGEPSFLLIGHRIGTFGVENSIGATLTEGELASLVTDTKRRLEAGQFAATDARFHFQLEAQY